MKGQTYVILAIIFTILISVFAVMNVSVVEVNYIFWSGESPLIFVILFSVLLGGILTTIVGSVKYIRLLRENKLLRAENNHLSSELGTLELNEGDREQTELVFEEKQGTDQTT